MSCSRTQRSASGEARTHNPSISGQALYHDCAPQLGSILCRYDACPTQYAPDLRGSILCMQGTQYAPRESILCMEHFVTLQCIVSNKLRFKVIHHLQYRENVHFLLSPPHFTLFKASNWQLNFYKKCYCAHCKLPTTCADPEGGQGVQTPYT